MERLRPFFPKIHGRPRVDDRRVLSGMIFVHRNGLRWRDAPAAHGPAKTLCNRWKRWSEPGLFGRIFEGLAAEATDPARILIDATSLTARRTASGLSVKQGGWAPHRTKGGMNTKLHGVTDGQGGPCGSS